MQIRAADGGNPADWRPATAVRLVTAGVLALALAACTADDGAGGDQGREPGGAEVTREQARMALEAARAPADGEFTGGNFRFGRAYDAGSSAESGLLGAFSWDIVYHRTNGELGSWSAGLDVFKSSGTALEAAQQVADRWPCADEPTAVDSVPADGYDYVRASYCRRLGADGYIAQLSAADGQVTANLTVSGPTPEVARSAALAVWGSLSPSAQAAVRELD